MRFLALGDSYTIGESVSEAERWPVQLVARLQAQGVSVAEPEIIAQTGWTTDDLVAAIAQADPQGPYDLVALLIGVNNQYRGRSQEEYRTQFVDLLIQAIALADGDPQNVIVISIPDWGVTPFASRQDSTAIAAEIDAFNAINREETANAGANYSDITPISRQAVTNEALIADDGLHPSGEMYAAWVEQMERMILEMIKD